ncbi:RHS repeat-associated core domain-containing protein [Streptomyces sp. NPDC003952]
MEETLFTWDETTLCEQTTVAGAPGAAAVTLTWNHDGHHPLTFRTYDPETARYFSPDPLGLRPAPNSVAYVGNPFTRFDPLGLAPDPDCEEIDAQIKKARESWTSPASLSRHYGDHGRDLNICDEDDYAMAADDLMSGSKPPDVREKESLMEGGTSTDANARRYWDEQPGLE